MRRLRESATLTIVLVLGVVGTSHAVSMTYTALAFRSVRTFECSVVNTGVKNATVTIQTVNAAGTSELELADQVIPPGQARILAVAPSTGSPYLYCKFILTAGKKAGLRGSYCVHVDELGTRCGASGDAR